MIACASGKLVRVDLNCQLENGEIFIISLNCDI